MMVHTMRSWWSKVGALDDQATMKIFNTKKTMEKYQSIKNLSQLVSFKNIFFYFSKLQTFFEKK